MNTEVSDYSNPYTENKSINEIEKWADDVHTSKGSFDYTFIIVMAIMISLIILSIII